MAANWAPAYVRTEDIDLLWPWIGPMIQRAFDKAPCLISPDELRQHGKDNHARFWVVSRGEADWPSAVAATTEHTNATVEILALAGDDMGEWLAPSLEAFESMAKEAGMIRVGIHGRRGWARVLAPMGYELRDTDEDGLVMMEKAL